MVNEKKHYIIVGSSYKTKRRIALDIVQEGYLDENLISEVQDYLKNNCLSNSLSVHVIPLESSDFESLKKYDMYFENVELIKTKEEFSRLINKDRNLNGMDVANYILTKVPCTHLKIQKLTYLCYAEYLCEKKERLFEDDIFAYSKGPVIKSVYNVFKKTKYKLFKPELEDDSKNYSKKHIYLPVRSRILASKDGIQKVASIDKTILKYGSLNGEELVELTHKNNSPWNNSGSGKKRYKKITDNCILEYHKFELL